MTISIRSTDADGGEPFVFALDDNAVWRDEGEWHPLSQNAEYTIGGMLVVETSLKRKGRPITLSTDQGEGLFTRADALDLAKKIAERPLAEMTLTLHDGRTFNVTWRAHDGNPIEFANHFGGYSNPTLTEDENNPTNWVRLKLQLMEV